MTNEFGQRVYPVIRYVIELLEKIRSGASDVPGGDEVTSKAKTLLTQFDVLGGRRHEYELAKRALVYWIDDVLINSDWKDAGWWSDHTLERHFYDSRERAWRFFDKAATARELPNQDALETFYLCACLGFWGQYRDRKPSKATWDTQELNAAAIAARASDKKDKEADGKKSTDDEWANLKPASDDESADENDTTQESTPKKPTGSMTWWDGDDQAFAKKTWGMQHSVDMSRLQMENAAAAAGAATTRSEPETLQDWIESVYRQLAPAPPEPYAPAGESQEPGEAAPLRGRAARTWALMSVLLAGGFLITLAILTLYRT